MDFRQVRTERSGSVVAIFILVVRNVTVTENVCLCQIILADGLNLYIVKMLFNCICTILNYSFWHTMEYGGELPSKYKLENSMNYVLVSFVNLRK